MNVPAIMGIVNVTPDSFSDGGRWFAEEAAVAHGAELVSHGADMLDIGGESARPGSDPVDAQEERRRVVPVIRRLRSLYPELPISIDTMKAEVAEAAVEAGATMINDVSGMTHDPDLARVAARHRLPYIVMHSQGKPKTMQHNPHYDDVVREVYAFLEHTVSAARAAGVEQVIADVGIGFGKTLDHNLSLLANHDHFRQLGVPLLLGVSRKSLFNKLLGIEDPQHRDDISLACHALLWNSADIVRVHTVRPYAQARTLACELNKRTRR